MANTIKHKRGTSNPSASDLVVGELAINTTDGSVFTETGGGTVVKVGRDVVDDTSPQLGGNLDVNGNDIVSTSNGDIDLDPNGSGVVVFKGNSTKGSGQFKLNCEQNSHGITVKGPPHSANADYTLTLPTTDGSADQVLKTDGSGNLSWVDQTSGGSTSPGGSNTQVQFNNSGSFGGSSNLTFDGTNLTCAGTVSAASPASSAAGLRKITTSTSSPSGGSDGDIWIKYTA